MENTNKLIAEFLGAKTTIIEGESNEYDMYGLIPTIIDSEYEQHYFTPEQMLFNEDWNWLMEIVNKIENILIKETDNCFNVTIGCGLYCTIQDAYGELVEINTCQSTKILGVYMAVVEFIEWYNNLTK